MFWAAAENAMPVRVGCRPVRDAVCLRKRHDAFDRFPVWLGRVVVGDESFGVSVVVVGHHFALREDWEERGFAPFVATVCHAGESETRILWNFALHDRDEFGDAGLRWPHFKAALVGKMRGRHAQPAHEQRQHGALRNRMRNVS